MEDNDEKPLGYGIGSDVPEDLCYQWAEEYFRDADAEIDKEPDDKFVPKTFNGRASSIKKKEKKPEKSKMAPKETMEEPACQQISLLEG